MISLSESQTQTDVRSTMFSLFVFKIKNQKITTQITEVSSRLN
jgi:hypothetical protein